MQIDKITDGEEFKEEIKRQDYDFRFNCGYNKSSTSMTIADKQEFITAIWLHYIFFMPQAELLQLRKGLLETLGVELIACKHAQHLYNMLVPTNAFDPTSKRLVDELVVDYSLECSNNRTAEEAIMLYWSDYICERDKQG